MSIHIVTDNGIHLLSASLRSEAKNGFVEAMANDLVAAAYGPLDLTSKIDVSLYLFHEAGYSAKAVALYADDATELAKQIHVTAGFGCSA